MKKLTIAALALAVLIFTFFTLPSKTDVVAESVESAYDIELVSSATLLPWGMAFLPDNSMLVTEKSGRLLRLEGDGVIEIGGVPETWAVGQGGLLDVALHPDYENNGWLYLAWASPSDDGAAGNLAIMRARIESDQLVDSETLYEAEPKTSEGRHFGGRMVFDDVGYLYFTLGDRGDRDTNPQDLTRAAGKVYRIHDDGRIPVDNPIVGMANAKSAIFTYGHRNQQGMVVHPESREIWIHEHGPRGGDEINILKSGANYGWPLVTHGINYWGTKITDKTSAPGFESPLFQWTPSIAPSGMAFVTSANYPDWKGSLLVGSLKFAYLERLVFDGGQVVRREKLFEGRGRFRDVRQGPDGFLYAAIEGVGVVRIRSGIE